MLFLFLWVSSLACLSSWEVGFYDSAMGSSQWKITTDVSESGGAASHSENSLNQPATPDQKKSHFTRNSSTELNWTSEKSKEILFLHICVCAYTQTYTADGFTSFPLSLKRYFMVTSVHNPPQNIISVPHCDSHSQIIQQRIFTENYLSLISPTTLVTGTIVTGKK